jgi:hypothetical protein
MGIAPISLSMGFNNLVVNLSDSFGLLWTKVVIEFLPKFIAALLLFIVGWIVGAVLEKAITQLIKTIKLDAALAKLGVESTLQKAGFKLDSGLFVGALVKWFIIVAFFIMAMDAAGLSEVTNLFGPLLIGFLKQVIVAVLVLVVGSLVADFLSRVVEGLTRAAEVKTARLLGSITKWAVWIFVIVIALSQLGVLSGFPQILFIGVVGMLALAAGLAFGLGGREHAGRVLDRIGSMIKSE